ncbi:hypothetical protein INR49_024480 [Caranx melampygus]|nr:hypothetical protein INR49_024480 [Caranx melampygus]
MSGVLLPGLSLGGSDGGVDWHRKAGRGGRERPPAATSGQAAAEAYWGSASTGKHGESPDGIDGGM